MGTDQPTDLLHHITIKRTEENRNIKSHKKEREEARFQSQHVLAPLASHRKGKKSKKRKRKESSKRQGKGDRIKEGKRLKEK